MWRSGRGGISYAERASTVPGPAFMSSDGYIRLSLEQLTLVTLTPACAGAEDEILSAAWSDGELALRAGYCEWVDPHWTPAISVGWSWFVDLSNHYRVVLGSIATNVMLTSAQGHDLGPEGTGICLHNWIESRDWAALLQPFLDSGQSSSAAL